MKRPLLLIANEGAIPNWVELLRKALAPFGELEIHTPPEVNQSLAKTLYKGIIIDAGIEEDPASLTARLKMSYPQVPVVIFTAAPTWEQVREAFHAGAADFLRKGMDEDEMRKTLIKIFNLEIQD